MNTVATTRWPGRDTVQTAIGRPTAMRLAEVEYQRVTEAADALQPDDWVRPTDCGEWDVHHLVAHIAGMGQRTHLGPHDLCAELRDLARATGRAPVLTADHDGLIVNDVVNEWARRPGRTYRLELTGPAGGIWASGTAGEAIVMDAADFCRILSGRSAPDQGNPSGLLATQVPF